MTITTTKPSRTTHCAPTSTPEQTRVRESRLGVRARWALRQQFKSRAKRKVFVLIAAYRTWEEISDVEEPDSPADLLESFEQAHQEGELDQQELDRVRTLLSTGHEGAGAQGDASRRRGKIVASDGPADPEE